MAHFGRPEDIFQIPFHFQLIFGTGAALAYLAALLTGRVRILWSRELILVLLLTGWFILGVPFAYWRSGSFETLVQVWFKTVLGLFLLSQTLTTVDRIRKLLWAIILSELIVTCVSIALSGRAELRVGDRVAGVSAGLLGWNFFGIAVAQICPFIGALYVCRRSPVRTGLLLSTFAALMWMLVLTASRGGFLNVLFSIILSCWFVLRGSARGRIACWVVLLCLLLSLARAPDVFFVRVQTIWNGSEAALSDTASAAEESTQGRKFLLGRAITYTLQYPIFGVGMGNFTNINGAELGQSEAWYATHNTFTQISSEAGIPALVLFLFLLATVVWHMKKVDERFARDPANDELRLLARATAVSAVSLAFGWFFANLAYDLYSYYSAAIAAGLWAVARQSARAPQLRSESAQLLRPIARLVPFQLD
jgi:O-antigen ligase